MFDGINLQSSSYSLIILIYFLYLVPQTILVIFVYIHFVFYVSKLLNKSFLGDSGTLLISFILSFIFIKLFNNQIILNSDEILIYMLIPGIDMIRLFLKE